MSQPKRRSRKSKLVPRCAEPEIEEVIETEEEEEQQIKIMNTMSLASQPHQPQPGPSKAGAGSIQFKVDIEVEEWIDDDMIEENFAKMQSERLSEALDKEIAEEADWNNDEYGKIWAEAVSDNEVEDKPLNEYEKLIKNQIDPSVLAEPKEKQEKEASCDPKKENPKSKTQKNEVTAKKSKPSKKKVASSEKTNECSTKTNELSKKNHDTKTKVAIEQHDEETDINTAPVPQIRQYKRPGPKSKTVEPQIKINIVYSEESPTSYHIDLHNQSSIDLPAASLEKQKKKSTLNTGYPIYEKGKVLDENQDLKVFIIPPNWRKWYESSRVSIDDLDIYEKSQNIDLEKFGKFENSDLEKFEKQNSDLKKLDKSENVTKSKSTVELVQIIVDEDDILTESEKIFHAVQSADVTHESDIKCTRMLHIELQNRIGHTRFVRHEFTKEEALIDFALRQWCNWQGLTKVRSVPLSYKCYVCNEAWWHLDPFQTHLKKHDSVQVSLEKQNQECHIIAHLGRPSFHEIPIQGDCWKCGKGPECHFGLKNQVYTCKGCKNTLYTCVALAEHEGICLTLWKNQMEQQKTKDVKAYKCKICPQIFFTEELLHKHQYFCHIPRSDYPMLVRLSQCHQCNQYFYIHKFHYCSFRIQKYRCKFCLRHFPSTHTCDIHVNHMRYNVVCPFCSEVVRCECMIANHLLAHNDRYMMVYKCLMCFGKNILLEDVAMVTRHADFVHKSSKYVRSMWCFTQVLLPRSLYDTKKVVTMHAPSTDHEKLKESFLNDLPKENRKELETEVTKPSTAEAEPETAAVKVKNEMENYFEEDSSQMDDDSEFIPLIIDTSSIKVEINDDFEGTEVNPADLIDITQTEIQPKTEINIETEMETQTKLDTVIVKKEAEDITSDQETSQNSSEKDSLTDMTKFSEKLQTFLENMDEEEQEIKENSYCCTLCDFEGNRKQYKIHLKSCDAPAPTKIEERICTKCNKSFKSMKDYVRHLPKHGFPRCKCTECDREFPNLSTWILHINVHIRRSFSIVKLLSTKSKVWRCKCCKEMVQMSSFFQHWEGHLALPKKKSSVSPVFQPDSTIITTEILQQITAIFEMTSTDQIPKNCIVCGRYFGRMCEKKRHLVEHLLDAAGEGVLKHGGLLCQLCGDKSVKPDEFRRHMRDHAGLTLYHCELCNKTFSDSSNFVKHKKVHNMEAYHCDDCNKKFVAKASLEAHIASHRAEPLSCARCAGKQFYSESAYRRHVRSVHDKAGGYKCHYCRERFLTLRQKWDHQWEAHHVRAQIADCPVCGKKFRKMSDVRNHMYSEHKADRARWLSIKAAFAR